MKALKALCLSTIVACTLGCENNEAIANRRALAAFYECSELNRRIERANRTWEARNKYLKGEISEYHGPASTTEVSILEEIANSIPLDCQAIFSWVQKYELERLSNPQPHENNPTITVSSKPRSWEYTFNYLDREVGH